MAESETAEGKVMPNRRYQARVVGETAWNDRPGVSIMQATIAESIAATVDRPLSEVRPFAVQVRDPELPHDITTLDVVCTVHFVVTTRDPSERN